MKDLQFYQDATRRICAGLDPKIMLENCYEYLRQFIPLDAIALATLEVDTRIYRTVQYFSKHIDVIDNWLDKPICVPIETMKYINERFPQKCHYVNDARTIPIDGPHRHLSHNEISFITNYVDLIPHDNSKRGVIWLFSQGFNRYTEEHCKMLEMLDGPFGLALSNLLTHQELVCLQRKLKDDNRFLQNELHPSSDRTLIGENSGLKEITETVKTIRNLNTTVLLLGETGVGKDVVANLLHFSSLRSSGPFIKVNCGAIPENLIDSELFGHTKGAFTGAVSDYRGRFERAHKGTIFLDEIGELPLSAQLRLLRVLQFKEIERVGGAELKKVDVRIISATNRDIPKLIQEGKFREDLWFRISVLPITIPPLRERRYDIPAIIEHLIISKSREFNLEIIPSVSPEVMERLQSYHWPGNVRELENAVEREIIRNMVSSKGSLLEFKELSNVNRPSRVIAKDNGNSNQIMSYDEYCKHLIISTLQKTEGKIHGKNGASDILGMNPSTLRNKMVKYGINFKCHNKKLDS